MSRGISPELRATYYRAKPFLPLWLRMKMRRRYAEMLRPKCAHFWPIDKSAGGVPEGWPGWPEGKQFAFVLSHDVESRAGLERVKQLAELEMEMGFRSSFNFVPEGEYRVSGELRDWLTERGFEVGVHDLHHDGHLYASKERFREKAGKINGFLEDWGAEGFRSAFMLRELDWLHDLNIAYDSSTFDTDPFEPQPDGCGTIFPFLVRETEDEGGGSYVELPYTLPQDSTLFLLLRERSPAIWLNKLDWVAEQGGMAKVNVHPDYIAGGEEKPGRHTYPIEFYRQLLQHVKDNHEGKYWSALPKEVAGFARTTLDPTEERGRHPASDGAAGVRPKVWIDLDNTPHVPFFEPIIEELERRGYPVLLTARDAFQVCALADEKGMPYLSVGRHHGKNRLAKAVGLGQRALQLLPIVRRERPAVGVSHGARSQLLVGNLLRLPTLLLEDYEYCQFPWMMRPTWEMAPEAFNNGGIAGDRDHFMQYPGIKEDVYAWKLNPDSSLLEELGIKDGEIVVTVRPPATEAHYHNPEAEVLFEKFMDRACATPGVRVVLLPRNDRQTEWIRSEWPQWFENGKTIVPAKAVDGMNLIWFSDLVVSGGGTMNREAAALHVPVYSIFRGTIGAVDRQLTEEGRLHLIETVDDVESRILLKKRIRPETNNGASKATLDAVVEAICKVADEAVARD